ncbi:MAG: hypothetical protein HC830_08695 [Bacteroidetes bacterium]|nr:hypothetical protein [Bacteroidota bacterium]
MIFLLPGDETLILAGICGEYIVTARKKGADWYIGGMTNELAREITVDLNFMEGKSFQMIEFADGMNADKFASDYTMVEKELKSRDIKIKMAPSGGYVAKISPDNL